MSTETTTKCDWCLKQIPMDDKHQCMCGAYVCDNPECWKQGGHGE